MLRDFAACIYGYNKERPEIYHNTLLSSWVKAKLQGMDYTMASFELFCREIVFRPCKKVLKPILKYVIVFNGSKLQGKHLHIMFFS